MATRYVRNIHRGALPDSTGECFEEGYSVLATNDVWDVSVVRFGSAAAAAPTVRHGIRGTFRVPENYVSGGTINIEWTTNLTSGDVVWDFECRAVAGNDTESLDQAGTEASVTVTDTAPSAANEKQQTSVSTGLTFAAEDIVEFGFFRDGVDAADTLAGAGLLFALDFSFSDA